MLDLAYNKGVVSDRTKEEATEEAAEGSDDEAAV